MTKFSLLLFTGQKQWISPKTANQAIDFSLSGISLIGNLTARDLDGCGVRVVVVGDSAKGDAEL